MQNSSSEIPPVPDFVRRLPQLRYGKMELPSRYLLSPLAGYTTLPFRRIIRRVGGVGLCTTDLVNARGLLEAKKRSLDLIATCAEDTPLAVQLFGAETVYLQEAARMLAARGIASIDINMGCPVNRITKGGSGAGLMRCADDTVKLVQAVVESVSIPVTVKMRLGWDDSQLTAPFFAREFEQVGVAAVMIHGRTRNQGFGGTVNLDGIRQVVEAVEKIPVIGNGDVRTVADAARMFEQTGCQGVSIGRGALANPWIFCQLSQWEQAGEYEPSGNFEDRLQMLRTQFELTEEWLGANRAVIGFRKMAHWYLKAMRVKPALRHAVQTVRTREAFLEALNEIRTAGPLGVSRTDELPEWTVPVPSGPNEKW